ncbi:MAG: DUF1801 domain-containing protein [Bacteroidetes bacterium]|nr:DUF1801 domain-containing protein [Bacteroidota bacterium]
MANSFTSPEEYITSLPEERQEPMRKLRQIMLDNLPEGFEEGFNNMIHYVVPFSLYPAGYHCPPKQPLPFISLASQKNFIAVYHMGVYANEALHKWFVSEYPNHAKRKLDMGKSCLRLKKMEDIPYELIADLVSRMSPQDWIDLYEANYKR